MTPDEIIRLAQSAYIPTQDLARLQQAQSWVLLQQRSSGPPPWLPVTLPSYPPAQPSRLGLPPAPVHEPTVLPRVGWRTWLITNDGRLAGHALRPHVQWPLREVYEAKHEVTKSTPHAAPAWDCKCGIYGLPKPPQITVTRDGVVIAHTPVDVLAMNDMRALGSFLPQGTFVSPEPPHTIAIGLAAFWGRIIEHSHGWRAQYAYPLVLTMVPDVADDIRRNYGVPVLCVWGVNQWQDVLNEALELYRRQNEHRRTAENSDR